MDISKIKISYADNSHIAELKEIWHECFGDSFDYINFFFENRFKSIKTVIALCDGKAIGAAYLMPVKAFEYGVLKNGWYGYAIGILKSFRKNGIYKMMHEKIMKDITEKNEFYILCPANEKLCEFYSSLGFKDFSYLNTVEIERCKTDNKIFEKEITAKKYFELRNKYFKSDGLIFWNEESIEYAIKENEFCGGFTSEFILNEKNFIVMARPFEDTIRIIESTVPSECLSDVTSYLCEEYKVNRVLWTRTSYEENGKNFLSGMAINLKKGDYPYLNLVLN